MRRGIILGYMLGLALSATGCSNTSYWDKPGAAPTEWEQVKAACLMEGAQQVPANLVYSVQPGSSYSSYSCDKKGRNCSTYGNYTPPTLQQNDANAALRDQVVRGCFARNGWVERRD